MNILNLFGGLNRILVMGLGVLLLILGVVMVIASSRGIRTIAAAGASAIPGAQVAGAASDVIEATT